MARYVIQKEEGTTWCDNPHPVRFPRRGAEHWRDEPWERRSAIDSGRRGYLCPGNREHGYPVWIVYNADDESEENLGVFDVYREAKECRDEANTSGPERRQ